jgi:lipopolysaccharide export LptBFGC system permease protein LptF
MKLLRSDSDRSRMAVLILILAIAATAAAVVFGEELGSWALTHLSGILD